MMILKGEVSLPVSHTRYQDFNWEKH